MRIHDLSHLPMSYQMSYQRYGGMLKETDDHGEAEV